MRNLVLAVGLVLMSVVGVAQDAEQKATEEKINWMSVEDAIKAQQTTPKKIMIDVYTKWCGPCRMMMANTFTDPKVIAYINENYYAVKFNAEGPDPVTFKGQTYTNENYDPNKTGRNSTHQFASIAQVEGRLAYPTVVYLDEELNLLTPVQGYLKPDQILPILNFFGQDAYKTTKYEDFVKNTYKP